MKSRRETHKRKGFPLKKLLIGTVLLIGIIGSSVSIVFAEQDIESLLVNWFDKNKEEALVELEESVQKEQEEQTKRLKEELQSEVEAAEEELKQYTEEKKEKISNELKQHTDDLIHSINISNEDKEKEIEAKFYKIFEEAKEQMNSIDLDKYEENKTNKDSEEQQENIKDTSKDKEEQSADESDRENELSGEDEE